MKKDKRTRGLGHKTLFFLGLVFAVIAGYAHWSDLKDAQDRRVALQGVAPQELSIQSFFNAPSPAPADEVHLSAQLDFSRQYPLEFGPLPLMPRGYMVPLVATDQTDPTADPIGILIFDGPRANLDESELDRLLDGITGMGALGPIVSLQGTTRSQGIFYPVIYKSLWAQGRTLPKGAIVMETFEGPRATALAPQTAGANLVLYGGLATVFLAAGVLVLAYRRGKHAKVEKPAATAHSLIAPYTPETVNGDSRQAGVQDMLLPNAPVSTGESDRMQVYKAKAQQTEAFLAMEQDDTDAPEVDDLEAPDAIGTFQLQSATPVQNDRDFRAQVETPQPVAWPTPSRGRGRFAALSLGSLVREDIKLSKRSLAQLDADPFVQRLARLN